MLVHGGLWKLQWRWVSLGYWLLLLTGSFVWLAGWAIGAWSWMPTVREAVLVVASALLLALGRDEVPRDGARWRIAPDGLPRVRQPGVCQPGAPLRGDAERQHARLRHEGASRGGLHVRRQSRRSRSRSRPRSEVRRAA